MKHIIPLLLLALLAGCAQGSAGNIPELSQSYSGSSIETGPFSFRYPAGWLLQGSMEEGSVAIGSNAAVFSSTQRPPPGSVFVGLTVLPIYYFLSPLDAPLGPVAVAENFTVNLSDVADPPQWGPISEITIGEHAAARVSGRAQNSDVLVLVVSYEGGFLLLVAGMASGELERHEPTIRAIAASGQYGPPDD